MLNLVSASARFCGPSTHLVELEVQLAKLLLGDQQSTHRNEIVLLIVLHDAIFGLLHAVAQGIEPSAERGRGAARCTRTHIRLVIEIGLRDRIRDAD